MHVHMFMSPEMLMHACMGSCRASMSAQSVMSERASISSARNSYAPSSARSTRQSFVPANSKGGARLTLHCSFFCHALQFGFRPSNAPEKEGVCGCFNQMC